MSPYSKAQKAIAILKDAVYSYLQERDGKPVKNSELGRALGIYSGYSSGQEGHIPRTILAIMESEEVIEQNSDKEWTLK